MLPQHKQHPGLTILIAVTLVIMTGATWVDKAWTLTLDKIKWPRIETIMGRSMFEGEGIGANDAVLLMLLGAILLYYLACRKPELKIWAAWRSQAGFILVSALVTGVYFVHSLKWIMGRARPDLVFNKGMAFSHWFSFGPHFITDGVYYGSFPSGHTSQMFILMSVAYVLAGDSRLPKPARMAGWFWGTGAVGASLVMGLTRCMTLSHWLTDILGSILVGWILMHLLYYHILRVPAQRRFILRHGSQPDLPDAWEIILCIHWLIGIAGLMMMVVGIRALLLQKGWWLLLLLFPGAFAAWFSWKKSTTLLCSVWQAIGDKNQKTDNPIDDPTSISK